MSDIVVVHLYPRELGINGDVGNVMAITQRARWRGMPIRVHHHEIDGVLPPSAHFVHIGSGPVSGQTSVREDLERIAPALRTWSDAGVPFLAIAGGWQLLGEQLVDRDGAVVAGAGILPTRATLTQGRRVGELIADTRLGEIAGFENHGSTAEILDPEAEPFARVIRREGDGPESEGVIIGNRVGTNVHGPLLPMNPAWADWFLAKAAELADVRFGSQGDGVDDDRITMVDDRAANARKAIRARLGG